MLIQVVYCHPLTDSYNHARFPTIVAALEESGHQVAVTDLYRDGFDAVMNADERRSYYEPHYDDAAASDATACCTASTASSFSTGSGHPASPSSGIGPRGASGRF